MLWGLVTIAIVGFIWLQVSTRSEPRADDPAFRADFELTDHQGKVQTDEDFAGRWMLVFFGFANCPDVCPTTLAEVAAVMDGLGSNAAQVPDSLEIEKLAIQQSTARKNYESKMADINSKNSLAQQKLQIEREKIKLARDNQANDLAVAKMNAKGRKK